MEKPEDKAFFRQLLDSSKETWDITVEIFLCADCHRHHAHMVMDL